jgi:putative membrane protein
MSTRRLLHLACCIPMLAATGCQMLRPHPSPSENQSTVALNTAAPTTGRTVIVRTRVSDNRIAGIVLIANNIDISYAQLAPSRAMSPDVQTFARHLTADHASMNATLNDILSRMDMLARDDSIGLAMRDGSRERRAQLEAIKGSLFDRGYVATEVQYHREMLDLIDNLLLPSASSTELRQYLAWLRPTERAHLAAAEQLLTTLTARQ